MNRIAGKGGVMMDRFYYSVFGPFIAQFLELKNSLGYKYHEGSWALTLFDRMALEKGVDQVEISKELAEEYSAIRPNETGKTRNNRVTVVSQFARFLNDLGFHCCLPKCGPVKNTYFPYIFSREQMRAMFMECDKLKLSSNNLNSGVCAIPAIMRLLYGTGLRVGETVNLKYDDVDLTGKTLIIRQTKSGMDRMVPISGSLAKVLNGYIRCRERLPAFKKADTFFLKPDGTPISMDSVYSWFRRILYKANIPFRGRGFGPRLHDLRHTFCVHSLAYMSESGVDLYYSLPVLSNYLGHKTLRETDIYVRLTAEMFPALLKKSSFICARAFPNLNTENYETN